MLKYILKCIRIVLMVNLFHVGLMLLALAGKENGSFAAFFVPFLTWVAAVLLFACKADVLDDPDLAILGAILAAAILVSLICTTFFALVEAIGMSACSMGGHGGLLVLLGGIVFLFPAE